MQGIGASARRDLEDRAETLRSAAGSRAIEIAVGILNERCTQHASIGIVIGKIVNDLVSRTVEADPIDRSAPKTALYCGPIQVAICSLYQTRIRIYAIGSLSDGAPEGVQSGVVLA